MQEDASCRGLGCPQISLFSPKIENPPQEEWGIKGVERAFRETIHATLPEVGVLTYEQGHGAP